MHSNETVIVLQALKFVCNELKDLVAEVRKTQDMLERIEGITLSFEDTSSEESEESEDSTHHSAPF